MFWDSLSQIAKNGLFLKGPRHLYLIALKISPSQSKRCKWNFPKCNQEFKTDHKEAKAEEIKNVTPCHPVMFLHKGEVLCSLPQLFFGWWFFLGIHFLREILRTHVSLKGCLLLLVYVDLGRRWKKCGRLERPCS